MTEEKEKKKKSGVISRREFLKDAGLVVGGAAIGSAVLLAACAPKEVTKTVTSPPITVTKEVVKEVPLEVAKSGAIVHNPSVCTACGVCEVMCSLYYEGIVGPALARSNIVREPFKGEHHHIICQQCPSPSCYFVCPLRDEALCIDEVTGARYINEDKCIGCGLCIDACPFDPPRIKINAENKVAFKCDLCRGREEGPICVEYCPFQALTFVPKDER